MVTLSFVPSSNSAEERSGEKRKKNTFFSLKSSIMVTYELLTVSGSPCSAEHAVESGGWERRKVGFTTVKLQPDSLTINSGQKL